MSLSLRVLLGFTFLLAISSAARLHAEEFDLIVRGGKYFDTDKLALVENKGIGIKDGRIATLSPDDKATAKQTLELDGTKTILPGLVDCHAHYNVKLFKNRREEFTAIPVVYLANGACVTFSCGEYDPEGMDSLRKQIEAGEKIGPKLITSGPYFGTARLTWQRNITPEEIKKEVDYWVSRGVGGFKAKGIRAEHLQPLIEAAHSHGLTVTGHLESGYRGSVNPRDAIEMGIDRVEHFLGGKMLSQDRPAYESLANAVDGSPEHLEIIRTYVEKGVWYDATISAFGYFGERKEFYDQWVDERSFFTPYVREKLSGKEHVPNELFERVFQAKQKLIKSYFEAGGKITLGTDHFSDGNYLPGFGVHRELAIFVKNGIPAAQAIKIASLNGAQALKIDRDYGSITVGKFADLYVVEGNPLEEIKSTRDGKWVVRAGKVHDCIQLFDSVRGKLGPTSEEEEAAW